MSRFSVLLALVAMGCTSSPTAPDANADGVDTGTPDVDAAVPDAYVQAPDAAEVDAFTAPMPCNLATPCPEGMFCAYAEGVCEGEAVCEPLPADCSESIDTIAPVCGCDAQTYRNDCERRLAGVALWATGECDPLACTRAGGCDNPDHTCVTLAGFCLGVGLCLEPVAFPCTGTGEGVCTCEGIVRDRCTAIARGSGIAPPSYCALEPAPDGGLSGS